MAQQLSRSVAETAMGGFADGAFAEAGSGSGRFVTDYQSAYGRRTDMLRETADYRL
jgi:hypothetical protein